MARWFSRIKQDKRRFKLRLTLKALLWATAAAPCLCAAWVTTSHPSASTAPKIAIHIGWPLALVLTIYYSIFDYRKP